MAQRVLVVGAGVVGLTCAVRLAEAGYDTHVVARDLPAETTSAVAGGLWLPYLAGPADAVVRWGRATFHELTGVAAADPRAGVRLADGLLLHRGAEPPPPSWLAAVRGLADLHPVAAPRPGFASGWALRVPLVDPGRYLPWLVARLAAAGGTLTRMALPALPRQGLVVNASGVSASALAQDPQVVPVRGQVVVLANPGLTRWWVDEDADGRQGAPTYALPRGDHVVVGGTGEVGAWDPDPDPDTARRILQRAVEVEPALAGARVLAHRVGLRPSRPSVRVEVQRHADGVDGAVVHCYGHGGSGYALAWGCADDVLSLVAGLSGGSGVARSAPSGS